MAWRTLDELPAKGFESWIHDASKGSVASYQDPRTGRLMVWEFSDRTEIHSWARRERAPKVPKRRVEQLERLLVQHAW